MIYNPLDLYYKSIIGAIPSDKKLTIRVKGNFDSVVLLLRKDGYDDAKRYNLVKDGDCFYVDIINLQVGLYFYCFELDYKTFIGKGKVFEGVITNKPEEYQLTIYDSNFKTPDWVKGGIIYQIFPDRFCSLIKDKNIKDGKILRNDWGGIPTFLPDEKGEVLNNDFFGGDFKGIESKLDYLKSLGVSIIYLNPIFEAYSNHRYDTGNFMEIDSLLGTIEDFTSLIKQADRRGIKIILDGVFNHTGSDSIYFNKSGRYDTLGAYQSKKSPFYDWFKFINFPEEYESWWGIKTLPSTKKNEGGFIDYISGKNGVLEYYTSLGLGGWRLDVVDELPGNFVKKIRERVKSINSDAIIIGEVWEDASNKVSYGVRREYFQGKELDSVMNYPLKDAIINFVKTLDVNPLLKVIYEQIDHYPQHVLHCLMNILSTHDTFRLLSALSQVDVNGKNKTEMSKIQLTGEALEKAKNRLKIATFLQYFLCGVPSVYYGDEVGMQGFSDPLNRGCFPWDDIDQDLLDWYKKLGNIRSSYDVFKDGAFEKIYADKGVFVFKRANDLQEVLIAINLLDKPLYLSFDGRLKELISSEKFDNYVCLQGESVGIFVNT